MISSTRWLENMIGWWNCFARFSENILFLFFFGFVLIWLSEIFYCGKRGRVLFWVIHLRVEWLRARKRLANHSARKKKNLSASQIKESPDFVGQICWFCNKNFRWVFQYSFWKNWWLFVHNSFLSVVSLLVTRFYG